MIWLYINARNNRHIYLNIVSYDNTMAPPPPPLVGKGIYKKPEWNRSVVVRSCSARSTAG